MVQWQKKILLLCGSHDGDARVCLSLCGAEVEQLSCVVQCWVDNTGRTLRNPGPLCYGEDCKVSLSKMLT